MGWEQLERLKDALKKKRRGKLSAGVLLLQDNAPPHTSAIAVAMATQCGFELLPHPPYSPDLAPSDYYLFPQIKLSLKGRVFSTDNDVMDAVDMYLGCQSKQWYYEGIAKLESRWQKCVELEGDYIEKV